MTTSSAQTPLVEMRDISIAFGGIRAVDGVSVDLYPGEVVGLLGHNLTMTLRLKNLKKKCSGPHTKKQK